MRVLLCSDIHGNAEALSAVLAEQADYVLCAGDIVHLGPQPAACIDLLRERAAVVARGNHDHGAAFRMACRGRELWDAVDKASRGVTDLILSDDDRRYLSLLPLQETITIGRVRFTIIHGAPSDPLYHCLPPGTPDEVWGSELSIVDTDVLVLGDTHLPFLYDQMRPIVVNPGSVGLPLDGDPRPQYAVWDDGVVTFHRCAHDHAALLAAFSRLPLPSSQVQTLIALFRGR